MTFGLALAGMAAFREPSGDIASRSAAPIDNIIHRGTSMTKQYLKPLALALAVSTALALSACGKQEPATDAPADSASTAPAAAGTTAAADLGKSIFDVSELDPAINACQDFNGFVNAKWVAANPIRREIGRASCRERV